LDYWKVTNSEHAIVITCRGHDKENTVGAAVGAFQALARTRQGAFTIIADLSEMTGYETSSRKAWQEGFYKHRARIVRLVLVGAQSPVIRMGAATVGALAGIPVKFVATWADIPK
jgi:hypothetical protein